MFMVKRPEKARKNGFRKVTLTLCTPKIPY